MYGSWRCDSDSDDRAGLPRSGVVDPSDDRAPCSAGEDWDSPMLVRWQRRLTLNGAATNEVDERTAATRRREKTAFIHT